MDRINIGILGYGLRGNLAKEFHQYKTKAKIAALCELDDRKIERFKQEVTDQCLFTHDYNVMLAIEDIHAILILTEDFKHKEHAIAAMEAGKDVFLEKPMAISIEDCDAIIECWQRTGRKLMIGFNMRYMTMYETMKSYIDQGIIGEVKAIWVRHFVGSGGHYYFQDWHRNQQGTHSLLLQKGSHDIDMIHLLAGAYVKNVSAFGGLDYYGSPAHFKEDGLINQTNVAIDVEDNHVVIMEMANGIKAAYLECHFTPDYARNYVIIGTKGQMENDDDHHTITIKSRHTNTLEDSSDLVIQLDDPKEGHDGSDAKIVKAFCEYILNDQLPKVTPMDGRMSVAVGVTAAESLRSGGALKRVPSPINILSEFSK